MNETALAVRDNGTVALQDEWSVDQLTAQVQKIQQAMDAVMQDGEHYGVIPGTDKPTLYKPGAEKLALLFRFDVEYDDPDEHWFPDGHYYTRVRCRLFHIPTGNRAASGLGSCTTRETKYAFRNAKRTCPSCGAEAIIKGKAEFGGGWVCWKQKDGCGAKFASGTEAIENQPVGKVPNDALPDTYNTVLKMACKRALVAAILNGTAASDIFTQDLDDFAGEAEQTVNPNPPSDEQFQRLADVLGKLEQELGDAEVGAEQRARAWAREHFGVATRDQLTAEQIDQLVEAMEQEFEQVRGA